MISKHVRLHLGGTLRSDTEPVTSAPTNATMIEFIIIEPKTASYNLFSPRRSSRPPAAPLGTREARACPSLSL